MTRKLVRALNYEVQAVPESRWTVAPDIAGTYELPGFICEVSACQVQAFPTEPSSDEGAVQDQLEPLLQRWAIAVELEHGGPIEFVFRGAQIDRQAANGSWQRYVSAVVHVELTVTAEKQTLSSLPVPVNLTPDFEFLRDRARLVRAGSPWVADHAYYALTWLEARYRTAGKGDKRKQAAEALNVDVDVLRQLGDLASTYEGRKRAPGKPPLSQAQTAWLRATVDALVRRAVQKEAGRLPETTLTTTDLPRVP